MDVMDWFVGEWLGRVGFMCWRGFLCIFVLVWFCEFFVWGMVGG